MLDPNGGRARLIEDGSALHIHIPAKLHLFVTCFIGFWLLGWAAGWFAAAGMILSGNAGWGNIFLLGWLGAWTAGGVVAISVFLWGVAGREHVVITPTTVILTRSIPVWTRRTECAMSSVSRLRVAPLPAMPAFDRNNQGFWAPMAKGAVTFTYGLHTLAFGLELDGAEAAKLVDLIQNRFPELAGQA